MKPAIRVLSRLAALGVLACAVLVVKSTAQLMGPASLQVDDVDGRQAVAGEVLVKFTHSLASHERLQFEQQTDADRNDAVGANGVRRIHSKRLNTRALLAFLRAHPDVAYVEPNYIVRADVAPPSDPWFDQLWGLLNVGQTVGTPGTPNADIKATLAWDVSTGSTANVVAVIDSGIDYTHSDLAPNIWSAPAPFSVTIAGKTINCPAGSHGFNAILNNCDPMDDFGHGTHVAGTIGAVGNNDIGVAGVNWTTRMIGVKFLDGTGVGTVANAVNAIEFAIQAAAATGTNVRILSNSWSAGNTVSLRDEIIKANANNMLFVASAGNDSSNNDVTPRYPSSYNVPNVIAVAATDNRDLLAPFSNYGPTSVHLAAPGSNILSTTPGDLYQYLSGTSMAVPHVSGTAALVLSRCPMDTATLKSTLLSTVDAIPVLTGKVLTGGRLNANAAIRSCIPDFTIAASPSAQASSAGSTTNYTITITANGGFSGAVALSVTGLPTGATATFTPASVTGSGTSTMTVNTSPSTPRGTFPLTVTGTSGATVHTTQVTLSTAINTPPVAVADTATTAEDTPATIAVLANDTDADGDLLTVASVGAPAHGTTAINAVNTITYAPAVNNNGADSFTYTISDGPDSFTYKASDGTLNSNVATVTITVTAVNDPPVANAQSVTTNQDTTKAITLTASDVDGDPLTYAVVTAPTHGTLSGTAPNLTYTPAAGYFGPDSFTFKANDGTVDSAAATVSLTVVHVNHAPVAAAQIVTAAEDTAKAVVLTATDADGDPLTYSVVAGPTHGALSGTAPNLTYTPALNYNGPDTFTFNVNDGTVDSTAATVSLTITAVNDAPTANAQSVTTAEDTAKAITLTGTDVDGDTLTYAITTQPAHGTLTGTAPNVTYTPALNYNGPDSFTFTVKDAALTSTAATVSITVTAVNDPPVANAQSVTTAEDTAKAITLTGSDVDGDSLTYAAATQPAHGTLTGTAPNVTYTPALNYNGPDSFTFTVKDATLASTAATVSITVTAVNDPPVANAQSVTTAEDTAKAITLTGSEVDGDSLTYAAATQPAHGTLTGTAPNVTYTPALNYNGPDSFTFTVKDATLASTAATVSITVTAVNDPPVANAQSVTTAEDTAKAITLTGSEVDGDS